MGKTESTDPIFGLTIERMPLADLLLDPRNPRFGLQDRGASQAEILDHIVEKFGVNDVLSSLAVNGYFEAEPLVCRKLKKSSKAVVVEGNRRLAACLIISGDPRASNQATRAAEFQALWEAHGNPPIDPAPAILFNEGEHEKSILSYLGVRHIASSQPWDSYAKAAWVAQVVESSGLSISQVSEMIGDRHRTVNRLLEGYYLVDQLVAEGEFVPSDSVRRGRGSVTDYPFSWVYTTLGYKTVRDYLNLEDSEATASPLQEDATKKGGVLLKALFGDRSRGRNAAIDDSREISQLAKAFASNDKVRMLESGKSIREILVLTQPIDERLSEGLNSVRDTLRSLVAGLLEQDIDEDTAVEFVRPASAVRKLASELEKKLKEIALDTDE